MIHAQAGSVSSCPCCGASKCEDTTLRDHRRGQGWHSGSHVGLGVSQAQQGGCILQGVPRGIPVVMERVTAGS